MELEPKATFVTISDAATSQIKAVIEQQNNPELFLRIYVQGGCGGIGYGMAIDSTLQQGDTEYMVNGLKVVVDRLSFPYVEGATIEFDDSGDKAGFRVNNPNATDLMSGEACGSCNCGAGGCC